LRSVDAEATAAPHLVRRSTVTDMDNNTKMPSDNVLPFRLEDRRTFHGDCGNPVADSNDHGPSPDESLRVMRAFVSIKNRKLRASLIEMLEGASRGLTPGSVHE
jgi:hypothetical protein